MRNRDFSLAVAVVLLATGVVGGIYYYTTRFPVLPVSPSYSWEAGNLAIGVAGNTFHFSLAVTNEGPVTLIAVNGTLNGVGGSGCALSIYPGHYNGCYFQFNVPCSALSGGYPYTLALTAKFLDGHTTTYDFDVNTGPFC